MATPKSLFFLGIVFLSFSIIGASRSLLENGDPAVFNVTSFGAVADDKTDNVEVSLFCFKHKIL